MILRALTSAGLATATALFAPTILTAPLACQEPPALLATSKYLFVVRGEWIYQYDIDTLLLKGRAAIPEPGAASQRAARKPARGRVGAQSSPSRSKPARSRQGTLQPNTLQPNTPRPNTPRPNTSEPLVIDRAAHVGAGGRYAGRNRRNGRGATKSGNAIQAGLKWLCDHQDKSGRWDADQFMKHDTTGAKCDGPGSAVHDIGVTGLAMLAMLGDGSTLRSGPYKEQLKRAAKWLRDQQGENGRFGNNAAHDFIYDHAIATYAMCEAYGISNYALLKKTAQKGINYLESHRNPYSVWRYQPRDNDNDISVTSWCLMACKSGAFFNLQVNKDAIELGASYLDQVSSANGRHGYTRASEPSARMPGKHSVKFPADKCEALTAAGLFCRFFIGQDPKDKPIMKAAANLLLAKLPEWDTTAGTIDHYYWYYGTYALFQMGGRHWKTWNRHMKRALLPHQSTEGNEAGSWDPEGVWGEQGGRVYSTAMSVLTLEADYRYSRLIR